MFLQTRESALNIPTSSQQAPHLIPHPMSQTTSHQTYATASLQPITHRTHTLRTPQNQTTSKYPHFTQTLKQTCNTSMRYQNHPKHPQMYTKNARWYRSSCHHDNSGAQPRHSNRSEPIRARSAISNLHRSQSVTATSQTRQSNIDPHPSAPPQNAFAPAHEGSNPNTISLRMTPQSHKYVAAIARVSSKHSKLQICTSHLNMHPFHLV